MMYEFTVLIGAATIVIQFAAAYFSYVIYKYNRLHSQWLAVTVALLILGVQRTTTLMTGLGWFPEFTTLMGVLNQITLPFIVSVFLMVGLFRMKENFERFEVLERKAVDKLKAFNDNKC